VYLKNLQVKGFKSFAEATSLTLEPGVTVVVGPNGSGKSNVVDAIGWVLGAQAPSAVRSQKMDDVIFAGTSKRPALGRAEVSLTIDNSAGLLPIDFTEVTITRLLFRSGDSEYSINGVPCRLLDIQEMLSDSGVGRQQHVIVSQGNIDAVLNARPEDRRLIIEEAAGVLKYRRRKERAERRLASTEANLTRIQDLLREVRRQLRPLERQADAARRHGGLVEELRALKVHVAGRELARLKERLEVSQRTRRELTEGDNRLRAGLADLDARILATEVELTELGASDIGDSLVRFETLRERARGQVALLAERARSVQRELDATVDAAVVASLEAERAQLRQEASQISEELEELSRVTAELEPLEEALDADRSRFEAEWGDGLPAPSGEAAALRSELSALRAARERSDTDREQLQRRRASMQERLDRLWEERDSAAVLHEQSSGEIPSAQARSVGAQQSLDTAEGALVAAEDNLRWTGEKHSGWVARVEALTLALDEARHRAGAERLAGLDGVLGTLLDLVEVDGGWEEAFEASVADALGAVVVADLASARRALEALAAGEHRGAVIALDGASSPAVRPLAGERVRDHVRAAPGLVRAAEIESLLDGLLANAVAVEGDWRAAAELASTNRDLVVVTRGGHRFGRSGWRLGAAGAGATGAALDEAREAAESAGQKAEAAASQREQARLVLDAARREKEDSERSLERLTSQAQRAADAMDRLDSDASEVAHEVESLTSLIEQIGDRLTGEVARLGALESELPAAEAAEAELGEKAAAMAMQRERIEERGVALRTRRTESDVRQAAVEERRRYVADRLDHLDTRLVGLVAEAEHAADRRVLLESRARATQRLGEFLAARLGEIDTALHALREERRRQSEAAREVAVRLESLRAERSTAETALEEGRARIQRAEIDDAETRTRLESATEALRAELDCDPDTAMAAECPSLPEGVTAPGRARELERELKAMGPINPLALQEFEELSERHRFLESQLDDVRRTRRELGKVIRAVDEEIVKVFASAFADVGEHFEALFETLFPGGVGRLRLTNPDDLLNCGIEIEAKPSGKNVRKLSLLSGGERSLTALAYLFAVFRARPSPFYVMDEVEAALDDVNLHRFLDLIAEFRSTAQLIIVSHQKRTMEAADVLYGVSMDPGGSSKVVSERAAEVVELRG
jgi:chromosome segregation protein